MKIRINILSTQIKNPFENQIDFTRYTEEEYDFAHNSVEDIVWDLVIVFEDIKEDIKLKYKEGGLVYFSGEPPMMHPLPKVFIDQFDEVFLPHIGLSHKKKTITHGHLNWLLGFKFSDKQDLFTNKTLRSLTPTKSKNISIITSSQKMMLGHNKRLRIIKKLQTDFPGQIDYFGKGINFIDSKSEGILPYRFHICMENSCIPHYWTEKIADPILGYSIPIYCGCTNVKDYLPGNYFTFSYNNYDELKVIVHNILVDPNNIYEKMLPELEKTRFVLLNRENMIDFSVQLALKQKNKVKNTSQTIRKLKINMYSPSTIKMRIHRLFLRILYNIFS